MPKIPLAPAETGAVKVFGISGISGGRRSRKPRPSGARRRHGSGPPTSWCSRWRPTPLCRLQTPTSNMSVRRLQRRGRRKHRSTNVKCRELASARWPWAPITPFRGRKPRLLAATVAGTPHHNAALDGLDGAQADNRASVAGCQVSAYGETTTPWNGRNETDLRFWGDLRPRLPSPCKYLYNMRKRRLIVLVRQTW